MCVDSAPRVQIPNSPPEESFREIGSFSFCLINEKHTVHSDVFVLSKAQLPKLPSTGDSSAMNLWGALMLGALAGLAVRFSRKRSTTC